MTYPKVPVWHAWSRKRQRAYLTEIIRTTQESEHRANDRWQAAVQHSAELAGRVKQLEKELERVTNSYERAGSDDPTARG